MSETPKSYRETIHAAARAASDSAKDTCWSQAIYDMVMGMLPLVDRASLTPEAAPAQTAVGEGELPKLQSSVYLDGTYAVLLERERQLREAIAQRDDRDRHIELAYSALGDVNRSVYLFDHIQKLIVQRDAEIRSHKITLARESATTARYDAKIAELEAQRDEARKELLQMTADCSQYAFIADVASTDVVNDRLRVIPALRKRAEAAEAKLAEGKPEPGELERLYKAAEKMDWMQVVLNYGPPCFHLDDDGTFCGRAQRWAGHDDSHKFIGLHALLRSLPSEPAGQQRGTVENGMGA